MADENGTGLVTGLNGEAGIKTEGEFEAMVDASEKPPVASGSTGSASTVRQNGRRGSPALAAVPTPVLSPAEMQAEREKLYQLKQVPMPLRPIYNQLPVDDIAFLITHVEVAYRAGLAAARSQQSAQQSACGHEAVMGMYNEVISKLLEGANLLDGPEPDVAGCLGSADAALARLREWEAEQLQRKQQQGQQQQSPRFIR